MNKLEIEKRIEEYTVEIRKLTRQLIYLISAEQNETKNKTFKSKNRKD